MNVRKCPYGGGGGVGEGSYSSSILLNEIQTMSSQLAKQSGLVY